MSTISIHEMAERTGLSMHTLRYYERVGIMNPVNRDASSGHRHFQESDVSWALFIKCLRATGMPIRDIIRYANLVRQGDETIPHRLQVLETHQQRVQEQQQLINQHLAAITFKVVSYRERHIIPTIEADLVSSLKEEALP